MARIPEKKAVFFELDGVLVERPRLDPDGEVPFFRGAIDALLRVDPRTFMLFVATNRTDIAFGQLREREFKRLCDKFIEATRAAGIQFAKIYTCPYHPKGRAKYRKDSVFRKPAPGMFKMAQQEFDLDLARCWMIGHTTTDVLAGSRAGLGTILVNTGHGGQDGTYLVEPHRTARNLGDAVRQIHEHEMSMKV